MHMLQIKALWCKLFSISFSESFFFKQFCLRELQADQYTNNNNRQINGPVDLFVFLYCACILMNEILNLSDQNIPFNSGRIKYQFLI